MATVDLNSDLGEGFGMWSMGDDAAMLDIVTSANVACGFHAGDSDIMLSISKLAKTKGVSIGAHPGYRDLHGFGRRPVPGLTASEIETMVAYQIGALQALATMAGHRVSFVKVHGALSNVACADPMTAKALASAIKAVDRDLIWVVLPRSEIERAGEAANLPLARELFADRAYEDDASLMSRSKPGSVLHDAEAIAERVLRMVNDQAVVSVIGQDHQDAGRHHLRARRHAGCGVDRPPGARRAREERPQDRAVRQGGEGLTVHYAVSGSGSLALTVSCGVCASIRFNSGMQEPQFVPAFSDAPIAGTEQAPALIASPMVLRPTPKHAQTIGPAPASPSPLRPDSSMRRSSAVTVSFSNSALTASHSTASSKAPLNRQSSMRSLANAAAR